MRLISWNCHFGGFEKEKIEAVLPLKPDVLVVPECEQVENSSTRHWIGDETGFGLAIYTFGDYRLSPLDAPDPNIRLVLPFKISNDKTDFTLFAVWTKDNKNVSYVMQTWNALQKYEKHLADERVVLAGDFNSTPKVKPDSESRDAEGKAVDHNRIVEFLAAKGIHSVYHWHVDELHGEETQPTYYHQWKQEQPFHLDYCFASDALAKCVKNVEVGAYDDWVQSKRSDHVPLIVDFDL